MSLASDTRDLTQRIVDEFGAKFVAANIGCSAQAIYQWIEPDNGTQNIFIRIANLLDELKDQGSIGKQLAMHAARLMLHRTGWEPVEKVKKGFSATSLIESMIRPNQEMVDVQTLLIDGLKDQQLTVEELKQIAQESRDVVEASIALQNQIEELLGDAVANGGKLAVPENRVLTVSKRN